MLREPQNGGMTQLKTPQAAVDERDAAPYISATPPPLFGSGGSKAAVPRTGIRAGRSIRYLMRDLDAWLNAHRIATREAR